MSRIEEQAFIIAGQAPGLLIPLAVIPLMPCTVPSHISNPCSSPGESRVPVQAAAPAQGVAAHGFYHPAPAASSTLMAVAMQSEV